VSDPRLLFTGPSPFGGHRYDLFDLCPRRYGHEHPDFPLPLRNESGALVSPPHDPDAPEPKSAWELIRGTMIHTGIAHHYARKRAKQTGDEATYERLYAPVASLAALHAQERPRAHPEDWGLWDDALRLGERVVKEYCKRYAFESSTVEVVEEVFVLELGENKAPYTFRLDLGLRDSSKKVWMVDHKTTTRLRRDHGWQYNISMQFQAYAVGGRAVYGSEYGGVVANMIECPEPDDMGTRPVFERPNMPNVSGFLAGFASRISEIYGRMKALHAAGIPPQKWPKKPSYRSCRAYGRLCPHYEKCSTEAD
jgi:hypothetical protein